MKFNDPRPPRSTRTRVLAGPFGDIPPTIIDPLSDVRAWLTEPTGVVTQLGEKRYIDKTIAEFLTVTLHAMVRHCAPRAPLYAIHDWSTMTGYDTDTRSYLMSWCLRHRRDFDRTAVIRPAMDPMIDMILSVTSTTLRLARMPLEIDTSLSNVIQRFQLGPSASALRESQRAIPR